jgi:teichuronic acid biosynthesis glycosyltransferase TuaC
MNILFLSNVYPNPFQPGKGIFNHYLARALAAQHKVRVITPVSWLDELRAKRQGSWSIPSQRVTIEDGISIYYPRYYYPPGFLRSWYGWFYWRSVCAVVRRVMDHDPPDVILSSWVHPDGEAAVRASLERGVPSVVLVGGSDVLLLSRDPGRRRCVVDVLRTSDSVVAVSSDLRSKICSLGLDPKKVHVWNRGIDLSVFSPGNRISSRDRLRIPTSVPVLLWVGRMVPVKGLDVLLRACHELRCMGFAFRLYLVGDGPLRLSLEAQAVRLGLSDIVSFVGSRNHDQLPDWYRAADLTVLPSHSEGLPNVLRESLSCGTPFVASRVGGIPEIAEEPWDHLVPPEDPGALADAIARALTDPARGGRSRFRPSSWADSAEELVKILRGITPQALPGASCRPG